MIMYTDMSKSITGTAMLMTVGTQVLELFNDSVLGQSSPQVQCQV